MLTNAPAATSTFSPELDPLRPVIDAMLSGSISERAALVQLITAACTTADGLGGPPKCMSGEADGTEVEAFPVGGPEGTFARSGDLYQVFDITVKSLGGVYRITAPPEAYYWPAGEFGLVFDHEDNGYPIPVTIFVLDGKIVRLDYNLGRRVRDIMDDVPPDQVLFRATP